MVSCTALKEEVAPAVVQERQLREATPKASPKADVTWTTTKLGAIARQGDFPKHLVSANHLQVQTPSPPTPQNYLIFPLGTNWTCTDN